MAQWCTNCGKEYRSRAETGCKSSCGQNCEGCCSNCDKHTLMARPLAVICGYNTKPSDGLQQMVNTIKKNVKEVEDGKKDEYTCKIEEGRIYNNEKLVDYTQWITFTKNGGYSVFTSYGG